MTTSQHLVYGISVGSTKFNWKEDTLQKSHSLMSYLCTKTFFPDSCPFSGQRGLSTSSLSQMLFASQMFWVREWSHMNSRCEKCNWFNVCVCVSELLMLRESAVLTALDNNGSPSQNWSSNVQCALIINVLIEHPPLRAREYFSFNGPCAPWP